MKWACYEQRRKMIDTYIDKEDADMDKKDEGMQWGEISRGDG